MVPSCFSSTIGVRPRGCTARYCLDSHTRCFLDPTLQPSHSACALVVFASIKPHCLSSSHSHLLFSCFNLLEHFFSFSRIARMFIERSSWRMGSCAQASIIFQPLYPSRDDGCLLGHGLLSEPMLPNGLVYVQHVPSSTRWSGACASCA